MFKDCKYTRWYMNIVSNAVANVNNRTIGYYEKHHIIPKSMGGSNKKTNLVKLTAREHFVCHLLLTKMTNDHRMSLALLRMMPKKSDPNNRYVPTSRMFALARKKVSEARMGEKNPMFGRNEPRTAETKANISKALLSSKTFKDSRASAEFRQKISDIQSVELIFYSVVTGAEIMRFKNARVAAAALGCTHGNLTAAARKHRPIGKRLKTLPELCFVRFAPGPTQ